MIELFGKQVKVRFEEGTEIIGEVSEVGIGYLVINGQNIPLDSNINGIEVL